MTIERIIGSNGETFDIIKLTDNEMSELNRCHEILRSRFERKGHIYTNEQRELCEWWLQGILRFEGVEKMISMAESAPFHSHSNLVVTGYAEIKEMESNE